MHFVFGLFAPGNIQPALRLVGVFFQRLTVNGMYGHAFAGCHNTDDAVARQRMTAAGKMHRHPRNQPLDFQGFALAFFGLDDFLETRQFDRLDHFFELRLLISRINRFQNVPTGNNPLADFGINVVNRFRLKIRQYVNQSLFGKLQTFTLEQTFENFLPQRNKLFAFISANITADGCFCLAGNHEPLPLR